MIIRWWCLQEVDTLRIVKYVVGGFYIALLRDEQNSVILPNLYNETLSRQRPSYDTLHSSLIMPCTETHQIVCQLLISLFDTKQTMLTQDEILIARNKLVAVCRRLDYIDILWLYAARLMNPEARPVTLKHLDERMTDLFIEYLYRQRESLITIESYELRTVSLFRSLLSLLFNQTRYEKAAQLCLFMKRNLCIEEPSFYLSGAMKQLYLERLVPIK